MAFNRRRILQSGAALGAVAFSGVQAKSFTVSVAPAAAEPLVVGAVQVGGVRSLAVELADGTLDLSAAGRAAGIDVPTTFDALADPLQVAIVRRVVAGVQGAGVQSGYRLSAARVQRLPLPKNTGRFAASGTQSVSFSRTARVAVFI